MSDRKLFEQVIRASRSSISKDVFKISEDNRYIDEEVEKLYATWKLGIICERKRIKHLLPDEDTLKEWIEQACFKSELGAKESVPAMLLEGFRQRLELQ